MSEKLTMPKNVQAFVNKYGRIGSKEQDATFWKEFRKAANAYADVQAKRICDLERALTAVTEQRDMLVEALEIAANRFRYPEFGCNWENVSKEIESALQSLTTKP